MRKSAFLVFALLVIITVSCEGKDEGDIIFTFDGEECTYSGPSEVDPGTHPIVQRNLTDLNAGFYIERLHTEKGKTVEDWIEYNEAIEDWYYSTPPPYVSAVGTTSYVSSNDQDAIWEWELKPGKVYVAGFYTHTEHRDLFLCPPLEMKEGVTE